MKLEIGFDQDGENPAEQDGAWKPYSFNSRHRNFVDLYKYLREDKPEAKNLGFASKLKVGTAFILSYYEHGECQWGLQGEVQQCQFDSVRVAGLLVWEHPVGDMGAKTYEDRQKDARSFLEEYNDWCNGRCYWYKVTDEEGKTHFCGGYVGEAHLRAGLLDSYPELFNEDRKTLKSSVELSGEAKFLLE